MASEGEVAGQHLWKHLDLLRGNKKQKATCLLLHSVRQALAPGLKVPDAKALTGQSQKN